MQIMERMQKCAAELARSGKCASWRAVAFELQFEPDLKEAFQWVPSEPGEAAFLWLHSPAIKAAIDELCFEATHSRNRQPPEAA
jgi:hypothetical protein